ncbi:hypothetical protein [Agromyces sp. C10]|uniref:hypothetical protein n=1 Tax=Agromyces sp. C10 TaxID=2935077 RepID=UPI00200AE4C4|nr:hypothetical protein [Agromyces sp. C10]MCK8609856.1 hypothetical protein [Agromyces sp. C10]
MSGSVGAHRTRRHRVAEWVARYLPLEVLGTVAAVAGSWAAYETSGSIVVAAVAGTVAESVGYYALVVVRGVRGHLASHRVGRIPSPAGRVVAAVALTLRGMLAEFGPAEVLDTLVVRPALLVASAAWLGPDPRAWLVGKLAADAVFYAIAIVSFELGRRVILPDGRTDAAPARRTRAIRGSAPRPELGVAVR